MLQIKMEMLGMLKIFFLLQYEMVWKVQASMLLQRLPFLLLLPFCMHIGKEGDVGVAGSCISLTLRRLVGGWNSVQELSKNS